MWVRSEYAGELAVLSAWMCALLPWSVLYASRDGARLIRGHFVYVFFQFAPGSGMEGLIQNVVLIGGGRTFGANEAVAFGYRLWVLGAFVMTLAVLLSFVYYLYDQALEERSPVDPVRVMGALLVTAGIPFAGATYFVHTGGLGVTVPVGVPFMFVLGGLLLIVERTENVPGEVETPPPIDSAGTVEDDVNE